MQLYIANYLLHIDEPFYMTIYITEISIFSFVPFLCDANIYLTNITIIILVEYAPVEKSTCIEFFVQLYNVPWEIELEDERSPAYFNMVHSVRRLVRNITLHIDNRTSI